MFTKIKHIPNNLQELFLYEITFIHNFPPFLYFQEDKEEEEAETLLYPFLYFSMFTMHYDIAKERIEKELQKIN